MTGDRIAYRYACRPERGAAGLARHEFPYFLLQFREPRGPVGSRKSSSRLFHTLMCTLSSKAKASDEFGLVILDQIPCVRRELVFEVCYEFLRTVQTYAPVAPQTDAQQVIKTGEVIHVRVRVAPRGILLC